MYPLLYSLFVGSEKAYVRLNTNCDERNYGVGNAGRRETHLSLCARCALGHILIKSAMERCLCLRSGPCR